MQYTMLFVTNAAQWCGQGVGKMVEKKFGVYINAEFEFCDQDRLNERDICIIVAHSFG